MPRVKLTAKIDTAEVDEAIKKANRLVELLQEASTIAAFWEVWIMRRTSPNLYQ